MMPFGPADEESVMKAIPSATTVQVKSDVIQIGHWQSHVAGKMIFLVTRFRVEVNRDQLRTTAV